MELTPKLKQAVKDFKAGNEDSFTSLYEESKKYIYTCIHKVMSGNDNALDITEEIMQETYLEIFLNIGQLENEDRFLSWAGTIATRKCFAYIKKNKKYVLLNEEDDTFENLSDSDAIIPEEVMQSKEKQRLVREIIDTQLTEVQKICIYDFYYNEMKQSEIAELYGMPLNTVKTNLSRAKAKIEEGVLHLEKKKGTKLYTFAPFFAMLFAEDVMAASVPVEVSSSVLSGVAEVSKKAVETGAATASEAVRAASSETVGATASTVSAGGTVPTVASKVGIIGKIAAASAKAKILMVVATVSLAGAVGGGAIIASQNGFFGDTPALNETQEAEEHQDVGDNKENDEGLLATESEEQVEESEIEELDATYIEYTYYSSMRNETVHFKVAHVPDEVWNGEQRDGAEALVRRSLIDHGEEMYEKFYFRLFPLGNIKDSGLDLEHMTDEEIGAYTDGIPDYTTLEKVKTEDSYMVFIEYDIELDMDEFKGYDLYINDYRTGKAYALLLNRTVEYYDSAQMLSILKSFEILEETETASEGEVIELSGDCISGTETRYADGTSDYEIYYADPDINKTIHYRITGYVQGVIPKNWGGYCRLIHTPEDEEGNYVRALSMYIEIMMDENYSFASKPEESFYDKAGGAVYDSSTFQRVETQKDHRTYLAGNREEFSIPNWKLYNLWIDDYATGRAFKIFLRSTQDFEYQELLDILNSIEIVEILE